MLNFMGCRDFPNENYNQELVGLSCDFGRFSACGSRKLGARPWTQNLRTYPRERGNVVQDVGIRGVGQRAVTFVRGDAAARFLDLFAEPDFLEIVMMVAQIAEVVGAHTAGPDRPVGVNVRA